MLKIIQWYNFAEISHHFMIKVDMMKAYDSVDWLLLRRVLEELSFAPKICGLDYGLFLVWFLLMEFFIFLFVHNFYGIFVKKNA